MKVWVLMGNDYPDAVFTDEEAGERIIAKLHAKHAAKNEERKASAGPSIYWRLYPFELDAAVDKEMG